MFDLIQIVADDPVSLNFSQCHFKISQSGVCSTTPTPQTGDNSLRKSPSSSNHSCNAFYRDQFGAERTKLITDVCYHVSVI